MSTSLREMIGALLDSLNEKKQLESLDSSTQNMLDQALNKIVEGTDSKISLVPDYKRKLYRSIINSLQYADNMIEQIPHPIKLSSNQLVNNPYIRAFFYTTSGVKKICNQSSELREFFQEPEHTQSSESYALLCMRKTKQNILGMQLQAGQVVKDVKQTRISFVDHHILSPAEDEDIARKELKCCIFEGLVNNALANISTLRNRRQHLETKQQILSSRLRSPNNGTGNKEKDIALRHEAINLEKVQQELQEIGYVTPEASLNQVNTILSRPENFVGIKNFSMQLDRDGILQSDNEHSRSINKLNLSEVSIKGQPPRIVTLVRINRDELVSTKVSLPQIL